MGVPNFTLLLSALGYKPFKTLKSFDGILIDIQSIMYIQFCVCNKVAESDILEDVCEGTFDWFVRLLRWVLAHPHEEPVKVVIAFDGASVPMKWPVQKQRRATVDLQDKITALKTAIFECNVISQTVSRYFESRLSSNRLPLYHDQPKDVHFLINHSGIAGEGEHKLYRHHFRRPLIVSIDNDVFLISLARLERQFDYVQIVKKVNSDVYLLEQHGLPGRSLLYASFLFGNDFIPGAISITPTNASALAEIIRSLTPAASLPEVVYDVASQMAYQKKIRFTSVDYFSDDTLKDYWKNCLWVLDYYSRHDFPQKYMRNRFYDAFDRNVLLSAFSCLDTLTLTYRRAVEEYGRLRTTKTELKPDVFSEEQMETLSPYLLPTPPDSELIYVAWSERKAIGQTSQHSLVAEVKRRIL